MGGAEFAPPLFGLFPALGFEEGAEGGAVDHDAIVEVHDIAGGGPIGGLWDGRGLGLGRRVGGSGR